MCNRKCFPVIPDFRGGRVAQLIVHVFYVACFGHCFPYVVILFLPCRSQFLKSLFLSSAFLITRTCMYVAHQWARIRKVCLLIVWLHIKTLNVHNVLQGVLNLVGL